MVRSFSRALSLLGAVAVVYAGGWSALSAQSASETPDLSGVWGRNTIDYAAPEQLQGKPRRSSDLYSFGVVVYEWLCGEWPFSGTFEEVVHQHLFIPPPFFSEKGVEIAPAIEKVVRKVLAKEPDQRFPSAADFAYDLEQAYKKTQISTITLPPSSRRQFMSPLPFAGEAYIKQERSLKLG